MSERYRYKDCPEGLNEEIYYKIRRRRLQMIAHSHAYYQIGESVITDKQFDTWAYELADLQLQYPEESKACDLYEEFKDFDGKTGMDMLNFQWGYQLGNFIYRYSRGQIQRQKI